MSMSNKERKQRYNDRHREQVRTSGRERARTMRSTEAGREADREKNRRWARNNPDKVRDKALRLKYGITLIEWNAMFERQGRCCARCQRTEPTAKGWATDHDHSTGAVRGILCHPCNHLLGLLGDDAPGVIAVSASFLEYLARGPA